MAVAGTLVPGLPDTRKPTGDPQTKLSIARWPAEIRLSEPEGKRLESPAGRRQEESRTNS